MQKFPSHLLWSPRKLWLLCGCKRSRNWTPHPSYLTLQEHPSPTCVTMPNLVTLRSNCSRKNIPLVIHFAPNDPPKQIPSAWIMWLGLTLTLRIQGISFVMVRTRVRVRVNPNRMTHAEGICVGESYGAKWITSGIFYLLTVWTKVRGHPEIWEVGPWPFRCGRGWPPRYISLSHVLLWWIWSL